MVRYCVAVVAQGALLLRPIYCQSMIPPLPTRDSILRAIHKLLDDFRIEGPELKSVFFATSPRLVVLLAPKL